MTASRLLRLSLVALCTAAAAALIAPTARADAQAPRALDDKAPALPLTVSYDKVSGTEDPPYVLKLKNVSKDPITVSAKVSPSVTFHAVEKTRDVPAHTIDAGQEWSIPGLAASDKVTVTAPGYAPLELTVP
jgi:hypothetical protein